MKLIVKAGKEWVKRAMLNTMGKTLKTTELNEESWFKMLRARHSPTEEYEIYIEAIVKERVYTHIVRHKEIGKYVATSRPDIEYSTPSNGLRFIGLRINAKRMIEICEQRLCKDAWDETSNFMFEVVENIPDETLKRLCTRPCVKYACCVGRKNCGFMKTKEYFEQRKFFTKNL